MENFKKFNISNNPDLSNFSKKKIEKYENDVKQTLEKKQKLREKNLLKLLLIMGICLVFFFIILFSVIIRLT